jgi:NAD(P)-dependent dehydrogenase (short-subunit alcohol dehydrogenase family)
MSKKKVAIITGGGGFFAYQHALAMHKINAEILLIDINKKKLIEIKTNLNKLNILVNILKVDITREAEILKLKKFIIKKFKKIDILINNASIDHIPNKKNIKFTNLTLKSWNKEIGVGLTGTFLCSKILGELMSIQKNGVILNISSDLSIIAPDQRIYSHLKFEKPITYSAIKHGIVGITKYLAAYWAKDNVRVNCISPGGIENNQNKLFIKKIKKLIPLGRMAKNDEYVGAIKFLCSEDSSYITGQNLIMDGGRSII